MTKTFQSSVIMGFSNPYPKKLSNSNPMRNRIYMERCLVEVHCCTVGGRAKQVTKNDKEYKVL